MFEKEVVGIDIGSDSIKIVFGVRKKNNFIIKDYKIVQIPQDISTKEDANIREESIFNFATEKIFQIFENEKWTEKKINMLLSFREIQERGINIPDIPENEIYPVITREMKKIYGDITDKRISFKVLGKTYAEKPELSVFTAMVPNSLIEKLSKLKFQIDNVDFYPYAYDRLIRNKLNDTENTMLIDIGSSKTTLMIYKGKCAEVFREINIGSDEITKTIASNLQIEYNAADEIKKKYGYVDKNGAQKLIDDGETRAGSINFSYQIVMDKLMRKLKNSVDYFRNQNSGEDISKIVILGAGAQLKGITGLLKDEFEKETSLFDFGNGFTIKKDVEEFTKDALALTAAAGTALSTDKFIRITADKSHDQKDAKKNIFKNKKLTAGIAAALLPFILLVLINYGIIFNYKMKIDNLKKNGTKISKGSNEFDEIETKLGQIKAQTAVMAALAGSATNVNKDFYTIAEIMPDKIYLTEFYYKNSAKSFVIRGNSVSSDGFPEFYVNTMVKNLRKNYSNVVLKGTKKSFSGEYFTAAFEVTFTKRNGGEQ